MEPEILNLDFPPFIETERLKIRCPQPGDGPIFNAAIVETLTDLQKWLGIYNDGAPTVDETDDDYVATLPDGRFKGLDLTCPFNMLPQLPALSLPAGLAADGLPVGLQIVGRRFADEAVLSMAAVVEARLGVAGFGADRFAAAHRAIA